MRGVFICVLIFVYAANAAPQDTVSLYTCYSKAREHYPATRDRMLYQESSDLKLRNIASTWFPQFVLGAQSSYQSDVTHISVSLPFPGVSFPLPAKDQYKLSLDVSQTLYDGSLSKRQKELERTSNLTDLQQLEVELYQLKDRVNSVYFSVLLLTENEKLLRTARQTIEEKRKSLESAVKNGVSMQSDLDVLDAELLKMDEKIFAAGQDRMSAIDILNELTGEKFSYDKTFLIPDAPAPDTTSGIRPEQVLYDLQMQKIDKSIQVAGSKNLPRIMLFSQVGYANPALNMLSNTFNTYYIIGATLKWNFWDWHTTKREKEVLSVQKDLVADRKSVFELNRDIAMRSEFSRMNKFRKSVELNKKEVQLRKNITETSSSKLSMGVITASDYLNDLNAQLQAELNLEINQTSLIQSVITYLNIKGEK